LPLEVVIDKLSPGWRVEHLLDELETRSGLGSDDAADRRHYFLPGDGNRPDRHGVDDLTRLLDRISPAWHEHLKVSNVQSWTPFTFDHFMPLPEVPERPGGRHYAVRLSRKRIGLAWALERDLAGREADLDWLAAKVNEAVSMFGHAGTVARLLSPAGLRLWGDGR